MSKKKLLVLPVIVVILVSFLGLSVMAAGNGSPSNDGFKVYDKNGSGSDVTAHFSGSQYTGSVDITEDSKIQEKINKIDSKLKPGDFKTKVIAIDITKKAGDSQQGTSPWKVLLTSTVKTDEVGIVAHKKADGSVECRVFKGTGKNTCAYITGVTDFSPFVLYTAKVKSSAKTGDFAPAYIAMISVALLACGAVFAVAAKKSSK